MVAQILIWMKLFQCLINKFLKLKRKEDHFVTKETIVTIQSSIGGERPPGYSSS